MRNCLEAITCLADYVIKYISGRLSGVGRRLQKLHRATALAPGYQLVLYREDSQGAYSSSEKRVKSCAYIEFL